LSKDILLPEWPESKRGTPNTFLRSALFSAIKSKDRVWLKDTLLASQGGFTIRFTGEQLNQEDLTLWETLVHLAKEKPLGDVCSFTAYEILTSMGLPTGASQYRCLESGITRLNACSVKITHGDRRTYFASLIDGGVKDEVTNHYTIQLNRQLIQLYGQNTWLDWDQQLLLKSKSLALFLHRYYSSHSDPYPVKLETLHKLSGSRNKQPAGFKVKVSSALDELVEIGFLESYNIEGNLVNVTRK
jgi:TrfA protein